MALIAFVAPILPGKREQWDRFIGELRGARHTEHEAANRRAGVRERTFLQETPDGAQLVIVTLEGDQPENAKLRAANEDTDFARWFVQQVKEIHGFDLREPLPPPVFVAETGRDGEAELGTTWAQLVKTHVKSGKEGELVQVLGQIQAIEKPGSGWVRSITGRDQKDPNSYYSIILFESEEKARAREGDPDRHQPLQAAIAKMEEIADAPREFVDLDIVADGSAASSSQETGAVFQRLIEKLINSETPGAFDELIAPDFIEHELLPGMLPGRESTRQLFADLHTAFPDIHADIEDVIAQGDRVVARMTWRGTQTGPFMGMPPTGKRASWQVLDIVRVANGQIVEHWGQMDVLNLMQQLGVQPAAERAAL